MRIFIRASLLLHSRSESSPWPKLILSCEISRNKSALCVEALHWRERMHNIHGQINNGQINKGQYCFNDSKNNKVKWENKDSIYQSIGQVKTLKDLLLLYVESKSSFANYRFLLFLLIWIYEIRESRHDHSTIFWLGDNENVQYFSSKTEMSRNCFVQ